MDRVGSNLIGFKSHRHRQRRNPRSLVNTGIGGFFISPWRAGVPCWRGWRGGSASDGPAQHRSLRGDGSHDPMANISILRWCALAHTCFPGTFRRRAPNQAASAGVAWLVSGHPGRDSMRLASPHRSFACDCAGVQNSPLRPRSRGRIRAPDEIAFRVSQHPQGVIRKHTVAPAGRDARQRPYRPSAADHVSRCRSA